MNSMESPVVFHSHGQQVVGMFHRPDGASTPVPCVLFFHGFTGNKTEVRRMFVRAARALADKGIASLRFDYRGSGDSAGEFAQMRISGCIDDAAAALDYLRLQPGVDSARVGIVGFSMGGLIASPLLASDPAVRAAVLWSPVANPEPLVDEFRGHWEWGKGRRGVVDMGGWSVSRAFIEEYAANRPLERLSKSNLASKVLLIHGTEDEAVPIGQSYEYFETLKAAGAKVSIQVIEGAGHTFESIELDRQVVTQTVRWLSKGLLRP